VSKCSPVQEICSATNWCAVASGSNHKVAIKTDGTVWAWGNGGCGQLGNGATTSRCSPVREITSSTNWDSISAGGSTSAAIRVLFEKGF
jgi:alpha-tubulin suppressor-like RCC1 family protein